jgi:arylsulfatase A-like enzyme
LWGENTVRVLYVDIDSLRPDHLGCYGYHRPTSPVIDEIAAQGVRFTNYYASDSPCVPSRAACFSGRPGIRNGIVAHEDTSIGSTLRYSNHERNGFAPLFPYHLAKSGFNTISFSSFADRHLAGWFHLGFRQFNLTSLKRGNEDADEVNAVALPWFQRHASDDDWFVHLNYWDPHTLYTMPESYAEEMARYPAPDWPDAATIERHQELTGIRTPRTLWVMTEKEGYGRSPIPTMPDQINSRDDFIHLINGYDGGIRYADEHLGMVVDELDRQGVLDETAIIISADHAEAFGELGQYMDHGSASPAVNRVPLIIRWAGITDDQAGSACDDLVTNVDFAPTLADALGLEQPPGWTGQSLVPLLRGKPLPEPRSTLVWTHGLHTRQRAVYDGRYLLIRTYHPAVYLFPPRMLFDLSVDLHQTDDLAEDLPDEVARLEGVLCEWEAAHVAATGASDPMHDLGAYPPSMLVTYDAYLDRLRVSGRVADAEMLQNRLARVATDYSPSPLDD